MINPADKTITVYLLKDEKYILDGVYHIYSEEELEWLTEKEKIEQPLTLKLSLYDDLEIDLREVFEG